MKSTTTILVFVFAFVVDGALLRSRSSMKQEPDTSCGKGFDSLVQGSKDYFKTAMEALFIHPAEFKWFKQNYPAKPEDEEDPEGFYYKQAMQTVKTIDKKEILCLTLFTIDDGCVKFKYIKLAK